LARKTFRRKLIHRGRRTIPVGAAGSQKQQRLASQLPSTSVLSLVSNI